MAKAVFSGFVKKIDVAADCKMVLSIFDPDDVLPELLPMRASRVWIEMETAAPEPEEVYDQNQKDAGKATEEDGQQRLDFSKAPAVTTDETGFQVPHVDADQPAGEPAPVVPLRDDEVPMEPETVLVGYRCTQCGAEVQELSGSCSECGCSVFDEIRAPLPGQAQAEEGDAHPATDVPLWVTCDRCNGSGADPDLEWQKTGDQLLEHYEPQRCTKCDGRGKVKNPALDVPVDAAEPGEAVTPKEPLCPICQGEWGRECSICGGEGVLKAQEGDAGADKSVGDI